MVNQFKSGPEIERLIQLLSKLPGLGPRSARRAVLHLIKKQEQLLLPLADAARSVAERIVLCCECGNADTSDPCSICTDPKRDGSMIIVIEDIADLWALERAGAMRTHYHVLGGTLSPLDGIGPEDLRIAELLKRIETKNIKEVILATGATVEGQTTAHYITSQLKNSAVTVSRLAHGVPIGGELDYLDEGTLTAALEQRKVF